MGRIVVFGLAVLGLTFLIKNGGFLQNWSIQMAVSASISGILAAAMGFLNYKRMEVLLKK